MSAKMAAETRRWVHPVVIGSGQRFVRDTNPASGLRLLDRHAFDAEIVVLSYAPDLNDLRPVAGEPNTDLGLAMLGIVPGHKTVDIPPGRCG